jgi:hypothetical protein
MATSWFKTSANANRPQLIEKRRAAARLAVIGLAPFVLGRVLPSDMGSRGWICPVLCMTGSPCPSCGATRAFTLLARADSRWRDYNTMTVLYACGALGASALVAACPVETWSQLRCEVDAMVMRIPRWGRWLGVFAVATPPWICARSKPAIRKNRWR